MSRVLSDFSQLTKAMIKPPEKPKARPAETPSSAQPRSREDADAAEVLAYFARPGGGESKRPHVAFRADPAKDLVSEQNAALEALAEEKVAADERIAELERRLAAEREAHEAVVRERNRLQGECGRLQGELRKCCQKGAGAAPSEAASAVQAESPKPTQGILSAPGAFAEVFPGEVREQVVAALLDGLGTAERSGRERRAEILRYVLAANPSSGELERRRAELRQILKDAGYYNDPKPLERLGLRLISGRTHWKLQYANVRVTMAKTPSDYRANLNNGNEIATRCF